MKGYYQQIGSKGIQKDSLLKNYFSGSRCIHCLYNSPSQSNNIIFYFYLIIVNEFLLLVLKLLENLKLLLRDFCFLLIRTRLLILLIRLVDICVIDNIHNFLKLHIIILNHELIEILRGEYEKH